MKHVTHLTLLIILLIAGLVAPGLISAQETPPPGCDPAMLSEKITAIQDNLDHAQALLSDSDTAGALESFNAAAALVDEVRGVCGVAVSVGIAEPAVIGPMPSVMATDQLCSLYPQYCVPMVGGGGQWPNEISGLRPAADASEFGVVRGLAADGAPYIGNPDAPIHFLEYIDFACPHCAAYEQEDIAPFMQQAVFSGQATYEVRLMAFVAGENSVNAAHAMLCAGEQGAAWEMHDALFAAYYSQQADAYTKENIQQIAAGLGLDSAALIDCIASNRYAGYMIGFSTSFNDLGLTGTPSMLVRYSESDEWQKLDDRSLDNLLALTADANKK